MVRIAVVTTFVLAFPVSAQEPLTVAEKSDYKATSKHSEVLEFCEALAAKSPVVRFTAMGTSGEGKKLPLLILGRSSDQHARRGESQRQARRLRASQHPCRRSGRQRRLAHARARHRARQGPRTAQEPRPAVLSGFQSGRQR